MTNEEAKQAYLDKTHIWYNGAQYDYIYARKIQRDRDGKTHIMVLELMDFNRNSLVSARLDRVSLTPPPDIEEKTENNNG